jgi:hypothetical protein
MSSNGIIAVVKLPQSVTQTETITLKSVPLNQEHLSDLLDVNTTGLENGYVLVYNAALGIWEPSPVEATAMDGGLF